MDRQEEKQKTEKMVFDLRKDYNFVLVLSIIHVQNVPNRNMAI